MVVIVILGIIGTVAIPKFINLSSDANTALILNLAGTIKSANSLVYSKSVIAGNEKQLRVEDAPYVINSAGESININKGYVIAQWADALENLLDIDVVYAKDFDGSTWIYRSWSDDKIEFSPPAAVIIDSAGYVLANPDCKLTYYNRLESSVTEYISFEINTDGC